MHFFSASSFPMFVAKKLLSKQLIFYPSYDIYLVNIAHKVKGRKITITCKDLFTDNTKCNECVHYHVSYLIDPSLKHDDCWVVLYRKQISLKGKSAILYFMDPDREYNNTIHYPIILEETIKRFYPE